MAAVEPCRACSEIIPVGGKKRSLNASSSQQVVSEFCKFVELLGRERFEIPDSNYMCRECFRRVEKLLKLRKDVLDCEKLLESKLKCAEPTPSIPLLKRKMDESTSPKARKQRRTTIDTPTRSAIRSLQTSGKSPLVAVVEKAHMKPAKVRCLPRSLRQLGRSIGRKSQTSIAIQSLKNPTIRAKILKHLGKDIQKELTSLCTKKSLSVFRDSSSSNLQNFSWKKLVAELEQKAPTMYIFLTMCAEVKRRERTSKSQKRVYRPDNIVAVGMCASLLLRNKNHNMNSLQRLVSLILHRGHAGKQVYRRLQRILLCLSHQETNRYLDKMGEKFDEEVLLWRDSMFEKSSENSATGVVDTTATVNPGSEDQDDGINTLDVAIETSQVELTREIDPCAQDLSDSNGAGSYSPLSGTGSSGSNSTTESEQLATSQSSSSSSSIDLDFLGPEVSPSHPTLMTFKIVGDNIDKELKPRDMRSDNQTRSLHYFHAYGVRDRLNMEGYDNNPPLTDMSRVQFELLLPTSEDEEVLRSNMSFLIARILKKNSQFFKEFGQGVERHIIHQFYEEMSRKSIVVPLGVITKSEQKLEDMVDIMDHLQQYVPTVTATEEVHVIGTENPVAVTVDNFHHVLLGGDQMTAARARGSQRVCSNSERGRDRLEGLKPVVEDWHAKVCLLGVFWKRFFKYSSGVDGGTLYQLRNLINRRNVTKDPPSNVTACEDFFLHVVEAHVIAACLTVFGMEKIEDIPSTRLFPEGASELDPAKRREVMMLGIHEIIEKYVDLSLMNRDNESGREIESDHVLSYACDVLTLGLLYMEFTDAIKEGDGDRILRCWKFFLVLFKATGRKNYAIEAFTILAQYHFIFTERMRMQLIWNRTVNVHGRPGKNVPCDLHNEHLNKECKGSIGGLGSNITDHSVQRVGRSLRSSMEILQNFDQVNNIRPESGHHTTYSSAADLNKLIKQLHHDSEVFKFQLGRQHSNFPKFSRNPMNKLPQSKILQWCQERYQQLITYQ